MLRETGPTFHIRVCTPLGYAPVRDFVPLTPVDYAEQNMCDISPGRA